MAFLLSALLFISSTYAETLTVKMYETAEKNHGKYIGNITMTDTEYGMLITPTLQGLTPGLHGLHVHQFNSCDNYGKAAGGHFDPALTSKHLGPYINKGHLGDLPALTVNDKGAANLIILAPRLRVTNIKNHALIIHAGGDNYSDTPKKLGGGGKRIACGNI